MEKLDREYFRDATWSERRMGWVSALPNARGFEGAQVEIITQTLGKNELAPRCAMNIGADTLLKFFKDGTYKNTYDLEADAEAKGRPFPLVGAKHVVSYKRKYVDELIGFKGDDAQSLYFGAVALSGSGIRFYGEYCMLLSENMVAGRNPNVLDRNSYDLIHPPLADRIGVNAKEAGNAKIEVAWLRTKWTEELNDMLVMKVAPTIDAPHRLVTPGAVAEGVLADEDFAEVHLRGSFAPSDLDEIRFAPEEQALASDILTRIDQSSPLDAVEWLWVWRRGLVDVACEKRGLRRRVTTAAGRTRRWQ